MNNLFGSNGVVYLLQYNKENLAERIFKIGRTFDLLRRASRIDVLMPHSVEVVYWINTENPEWLENYWHKRFASKRRRGSGVKKSSEWFNLTLEDVEEFKSYTPVPMPVENSNQNALDFAGRNLRQEAIKRVSAYYEARISEHSQYTTKLVNRCISQMAKLNPDVLRLSAKGKSEDYAIEQWEKNAYKSADKAVGNEQYNR